MVSERGQASVELVAAVPLVLAVGAIAWQLALAGHTAWMTSHAARAGARADAVGADARRRPRSALPGGAAARVGGPAAAGRRRARAGTRAGAALPLAQPGERRSHRVPREAGR